MSEANSLRLLVSRRAFLGRSSLGLGALALASLADPARLWGSDASKREGVKVERWPGVLWLAPEPAEPFAALTRAVSARHPEYPPYGGGHDTLIPHLTVGHHDEPPKDLDAELRRGLPIAARATHVVQFVEVGPDRWRGRRCFPLGG